MCAAPTDARDARHLSLDGVGADGVDRPRRAHVLVIGVGGTGCAAAAALAAAGIGRLLLVDFDRVDASNLARQSLYTPTDVGRDKVAVAAARLRAQNPAVDIDTVAARLCGDALERAAAAADVALDCSDNFASRFELNRACVATATPLVTGSAIRFEGQLAVFGPDYDSGPCYRCLYAEDDEALEDCQGAGVLGPVPAAVGALMAVEACKLVIGNGQASRMSLYDALSGDWRQLGVAKRADCPACGGIRNSTRR